MKSGRQTHQALDRQALAGVLAGHRDARSSQRPCRKVLARGGPAVFEDGRSAVGLGTLLVKELRRRARSI